MKLFFNIFFICISVYSFAQRPEIPRELTSLLNVPYLERGGSNIEESPGGILKFDKLVAIKTATTKGERVDILLYINTRTGAFATRTEKEGTFVGDQFDTDSKDFKLSYFSPKGKVIQFYTRLKGSVLKKYFATMNTEVVAYTPSIPMNNTWFFKKSAEIRTLPQNFVAAKYKANGSNAPTLVLSGYPPAEKLLASKFLGYSGIGYVKTDKGIYMITEVKPVSAGNSFVATKWKEVNLTLDLSQFESAEGEFYTKTGEALEKKLNKPDKIQSGACASLEHERAIEKKRILMNQQDLLGKSARGNMINDKNVQNALAAMQDPTAQFELERIETEIKLCKAIDRRNNQQITDLDKRKTECLETKLGDIANAKAESDAVDARFGLDKVKALPEKQKVWKKFSHQTSKECMKIL